MNSMMYMNSYVQYFKYDNLLFHYSYGYYTSYKFERFLIAGIGFYDHQELR